MDKHCEIFAILHICLCSQRRVLSLLAVQCTCTHYTHYTQPHCSIRYLHILMVLVYDYIWQMAIPETKREKRNNTDRERARVIAIKRDKWRER